MPLGLWKSKWEIHREDMERFWAEMDRRHAEWREEMDRWREEHRGVDAKFRDMRRRSDEIHSECKELRADYGREITETRRFNRELLIRLEKTYGNLGSALEVMGEKLEVLGERVLANTEEVKAQTQAILKLVDRFEEADGRPPV